MPVQFGRPETQLMIRDVVRAGSEVACDCMELRSSSGPWERLRSMLSELGASPSSNSGLVSSSTEPHTFPRHRKIPVSGHRSRMREHKLVHYTYRPISDVARRSRGPFTHLCRAERGRKSADVALSPPQTTVLHFDTGQREKVVWSCLYWDAAF